MGYDLWKDQTANVLSARSGRAASCRKESESGEGASKVNGNPALASMKAIEFGFKYSTAASAKIFQVIQ